MVICEARGRLLFTHIRRKQLFLLDILVLVLSGMPGDVTTRMFYDFHTLCDDSPENIIVWLEARNRGSEGRPVHL